MLPSRACAYERVTKGIATPRRETTWASISLRRRASIEAATVGNGEHSGRAGDEGVGPSNSDGRQGGEGMVAAAAEDIAGAIAGSSSSISEHLS